MAGTVSKYNITYVLYMAGIVSKYNITYVLYMAISHGIFFKVSIFQYYYIASKYNITYVLYMAISNDVFFKASILRGSTIQRTHFIWLILRGNTI